MPKPGWLISLFFCLVFAASAYALNLTITSPQKLETLTYDPTLVIQGQTSPRAFLTLNNVTLEVDNQGNFSAALLLNGAKNYAQIRAWDGTAEAVKEVRTLQLLTFPDIDGDNSKNVEWARREIIYLTTMRELESMPDGMFYPDAYMTRAEMATWLVRALNLPLVQATVDVCSDVPKEHWRANFIKTALDHGFFTTKGSFFYPDEPVSRAQVAEIVIKALGYEKKSSKFSHFFDVEQSGASSGAINEAFVNNLMIGVSTKRLIFAPRRYMTRAEAAKLFSRLPVEKSKIKDLFDYSTGYNWSTACRVSTPPKIVWVKMEPGVLPMMTPKKILMEVYVEDAQGADDVGYVKADLSRLGGPVNAALFDDGTNGDKVAGDNIYSLEFDTNFQTDGVWSIFVSAFDKSGLSASTTVKLEVKD